MKVLFTYDYGEEKMERVRSLGYEIQVVREEGLVYSEELRDSEILVCYNPFKTLEIAKLKKLKWIQLSSVGIDQVPLENVRNSHIILTNNRGGYGIPIGEWIVLKTLELFKHSYDFYKKQMNKVWKMDTSIFELHGKTIGFIGTGNIAFEAAKRLQGFEMEVIGLNTSGKNVEYFDKCYPLSEIDNMLSRCDVLVVTIPYTKETHKLINKDRFENMKDGAYFINVSRGSIVDEELLIRYLKSGKIKGAALDVFEEEPLNMESPLWELENLILTPHNSWVSERRNERRFETIYENLRKYKLGEKLNNIIDMEKGY